MPKRNKTTNELWEEWEQKIKSSVILQIDFETVHSVFSIFVEKNNVNGFGYRANFVEDGTQFDSLTHSTLVGVVILAVDSAFTGYKVLKIINYE